MNSVCSRPEGRTRPKNMIPPVRDHSHSGGWLDRCFTQTRSRVMVMVRGRVRVRVREGQGYGQGLLVTVGSELKGTVRTER